MNRMLPDKKIKDRTKNTLKTKCLTGHRWKRTGKRQRQEVKKQQKQYNENNYQNKTQKA